MDFWDFLHWWAHQCVLFFPECIKLLIWLLIMFLHLSDGLFSFFKAQWWPVSLALRAPLTACCEFAAKANKRKCHTWNQQTFYLLKWWWNNDRIDHTWSWKSFWINCPISLGPFRWGDNVLTFLKPVFQFWCKYPINKAESLHFNFISIISCKNHCGSLQGPNYENCVTVQKGSKKGMMSSERVIITLFFYLIKNGCCKSNIM